MRVLFLTHLIACAGLALQHVSATPIRVVVVTSHQEVPTFRLGHAAANSFSESAYVAGTLDAGTGHARGNGHGRCPKKMLKDKFNNLSNTLRQALGWPIIETLPRIDEPKGDIVHIVPFHPITALPVDPHTSHDVNNPHDPLPAEHNNPHAKHRKHSKFRHRCGTFIRRMHRAIMTLGPWEGRAVAFVLGCGIGVLIRMLWVLAVVSYRIIKGESNDTQYHLVCEHHPGFACDDHADDLFIAHPDDAIYVHGQQEMFLPPPVYVYQSVEEEAGDLTNEKV